MVERVELPGFLLGKFYGDFTDPSQYKDTLDLLLRKLGPSTPLVQPDSGELERLKEQLAAAQAAAAQHESALNRLLKYSPCPRASSSALAHFSRQLSVS